MSWRAQGLRTWLLQRLTAVYMILYAFSFSFYFLAIEQLDYLQWRALFARPWVNIGTSLFFIALLYHAWVGVRDILIDYVSGNAWRFVIWTLVSLLQVTLAIWATMILWSVVQL